MKCCYDVVLLSWRCSWAAKYCSNSSLYRQSWGKLQIHVQLQWENGKNSVSFFAVFFLPTVFFCVLFFKYSWLPGQWNQRPNCLVLSWYLSWLNLIHCLKASLIFRVGTDNMAGAAYTGFLSRFVGWVQFANFKTAKSLVRKKRISADLVLVWVYTPPCFVSHVEDWKVCACSREKLQIMDLCNSEFVTFAISAWPKRNFDLCHTND